jgi:cytochrome c
MVFRTVPSWAARACATGTLLAAATLAASWTIGGAAARDMELGRYLASECMTCHRAATATSTIPDIFGMPEPTFAEVVRAYKDKRLANPVMQSIAGRLNEEEIAALATYFSVTAKP